MRVRFDDEKSRRIVKKEVARKVIEFCELRISKDVTADKGYGLEELRLVNKIRQLNKRGRL